MHILGIDVSTTSSKALLMNDQGEVIAVASSPHTLQTPKPLWSEQDPMEWWKAVTASIHAVIEHAQGKSLEIGAIGLTGQMHGLVLLDRTGQILRPAILWNDQRTQSQCDEIHRRIGRDQFIRISGNLALPGFTAPKMLWVAENEPDVYAQVKHILLPKDYIRYRLTSEYAMDKADGSGTVLFDLAKRDWSPELIKGLGITADWLPPTFEGTELTGEITQEAAGVTGLRPGIPVYAGGGDQAAQAVGVGAVEPGVIALTLGTSGVVFATTPSAMVEPKGRLHSFCHAFPGKWHFMGVMLSAAGGLHWYQDTLAPGISYEDLLKEAQNVPAGSEGLLYLPYLCGERTPYADPLARGAFIGLTLRHSRGHMTRALLEGVSFGLKDIFILIKQAGLGEIHQVRASGGGVKSILWRQILADVLETQLVTVNAIEGAAYGAALLAGVGAGVWSDVPTACQQVIKITGSIAPDERHTAKYLDMYSIFTGLYPVLKPSFEKMI